MSTCIFKSAELTPGTVLSGDSAEFSVILTIGPDYVKGPSRIIYDFPGTLGMSRPSLLHQEEHGYLEAYISNPSVTYKVNVWDLEVVDFSTPQKTSWRGMAGRMGVLDLGEGLKEGDTVEFRWGDNGRGFGPGTKVTTVVPRQNYECEIEVRYFDSQEKGLPDMARSYDGYDRPVPDYSIPLKFKVLQREPRKLRLVRTFNRAILVPEDQFRNVPPVFSSQELVAAPVDGVRNDEFGTFEFKDKNIMVRSRSLPLYDTPAMDNVFEGKNIFWGDIHTHSQFSNDCFEREKMDMQPADLMRFAKNVSCLDFYATSDHHEPHKRTRNHITRARWDITMEAVEKYTKPGEFVAFPGCEYRCTRGDTVLIFKDIHPYDTIYHPEWTDVRELWKGLKGIDYMTIPHFHNAGGLKDGEWFYNEELACEPVLEIFSCHGSYERDDALENQTPQTKPRRHDRFGAYFIKQGIKYGFVGNSDGHKGHVGFNGVTAVYAENLDRESILAAYRARNVYATTNARLRLLFTGNGKLMGSVIPNDAQKCFVIDAVGENRLKKIDLFKNGDHYKQFIPDGISFKTELTVNESEKSSWYVRATQVDNQIAYSSPVWFE